MFPIWRHMIGGFSIPLPYAEDADAPHSCWGQPSLTPLCILQSLPQHPELPQALCCSSDSSLLQSADQDEPFSGQILNKWVGFSCPGNAFKSFKHAHACHWWEANVGRGEGTAGGIRNQGSPNCTENLPLCSLIWQAERRAETICT